MTPEKIKKLKELTPHVLDALTRGLIYELIKDYEAANESRKALHSKDCDVPGGSEDRSVF